MFSDRRVTAYRAFARDNPLMRFICLRLLYHKSNRRKPDTAGTPCFWPHGKKDLMINPQSGAGNRLPCFARDNPLRFICPRLLISQIKSASRHGGTPCFCLWQKRFDDKCPQTGVIAHKLRDNPLMRFICSRLLYHTIPFKPLPKWVK